MRCFLTSLLAILATILLSCGSAPASSSPLRIGVMEWPGFYPVMAGVVDGTFAQQGLTVEVRCFPDNPSLNRALRHHEVDVITGAAADALLMRAQGMSVRILGALDASDGADVLLARPGVERLGETVDQRVSFEGINSFSHLFVLDALERAGVSEDRILAQDLPGIDVPAALLAGRLDVGHTWGTLAVAAQAQGCRILARAGDHPGIITDILATRQDVIDRQSADLHRLVLAIYARVDHYRSREPELLAAAATFLGKKPEDLMPVTGQVTLLSRDESLMWMTDPGPAGALRQILQVQAGLLHRRGQFPDNARVEELILPRFLVP